MGLDTSYSIRTGFGSTRYRKRATPSSSGASIQARAPSLKLQQLSTLPPGFAGTDFTSEIRISADGRFVYGANRTHDTIVVFSVGGGGYLTRVDQASTLGDYPRTFTIDPFNLFMLVGNQRADNVTSFRINWLTGQLTFTGHYAPVGSPSAIVFLS